MMELAEARTERRYLSCAETAKLIRGALKKAHPGVKFSVRSDTYAGGASIRVRWTDGPTVDAVEKVAKPYSGAAFDGMIDLKVYADHWLMPDGSVTIARREGTTGSLPEVIGDPVGPTAELVSLGADFVFCDRDLSPAVTEWIHEWVAASKGDGKPYDPNGEYEVVRMPEGSPMEFVPGGRSWGSDVSWRVSRHLTVKADGTFDWSGS